MTKTDKITFVATSCGRQDLLEQTLDSFIQFNTAAIERYIVVEDSGKPGVNDKLKAKYAHLPFTWIENAENIGQILSIDKAYAMVKTPYVFHCEDDWQFYRGGFIEESLSILKEAEAIIQVWLREVNDTNGHPIEPGVYKTTDAVLFKLMAANYNNRWHGFSFNPGLKRMEDYRPYKTLTQFLGKGNSGAEQEIGNYYFEHGYRAAILLRGAVKHIGWHASTRKKSMIWNLDTAKQEHHSSPRLAKMLLRILPKDKPVIDLGCGKGTYIAELAKHGFNCTGYEGTPDIAEIADFKDIQQMDLSKPQQFPGRGTVICLEVAEHIEKAYEQALLDNINAACDEWLIFSWAIKGQGGCGHVNEQNPAYVLSKLSAMGFQYQPQLSEALRKEAGADLWWFNKSIYVFKRKV